MKSNPNQDIGTIPLNSKLEGIARRLTEQHSLITSHSLTILKSIEMAERPLFSLPKDQWEHFVGHSNIAHNYAAISQHEIKLPKQYATALPKSYAAAFSEIDLNLPCGLAFRNSDIIEDTGDSFERKEYSNKEILSLLSPLSEPKVTSTRSEAKELLKGVHQEFESKQLEYESNPRKVVCMVALLIDGTKIRIDSVTATGNSTFKLTGRSIEKNAVRTVTAGLATVCFEIRVLDKTPPRPKLVDTTTK